MRHDPCTLSTPARRRRSLHAMRFGVAVGFGGSPPAPCFLGEPGAAVAPCAI